jgi:hypothetical protein
MTKILLRLFAGLLIAFPLQAQEKVYMPWIEVLNMHPDYQVATTRLFKTYVDAGNEYLILLPEHKDSSLYDESIEQSMENAKDIGAMYYIRAELNRVGETAVFSLSMYRTADGIKTWNSLQKAASPDDLDPILEHIARNLGKVDKEETSDIYSVSGYDSQSLRRKNANSSYGLTIGGGFSGVLDAVHHAPAGFGAVWQYDTRNLILDITGEMYFSNVNVFSLSINSWKPITSKPSTFFAGGGLGFGGIVVDTYEPDYTYEGYNSSSRSGIILYAGGGYLINRDATVSLRLSGKAYLPAFKVEGVVPAGVLFNITLLF